MSQQHCAEGAPGAGPLKLIARNSVILGTGFGLLTATAALASTAATGMLLGGVAPFWEYARAT